MPVEDERQAKFIAGLQLALHKERATQRTYRALAAREKSETRRRVLLSLADTEGGHATRWASRLVELGADGPRRPGIALRTNLEMGPGAEWHGQRFAPARKR